MESCRVGFEYRIFDFKFDQVLEINLFSLEDCGLGTQPLELTVDSI